AGEAPLGDQTSADLAAYRLERLLQARSRLDERAGAAADGRQPAQETVVDGGVDADREHACSAQLGLQAFQHARFVAHLPVREQDDHGHAITALRAAAD